MLRMATLLLLGQAWLMACFPFDDTRKAQLNPGPPDAGPLADASSDGSSPDAGPAPKTLANECLQAELAEGASKPFDVDTSGLSSTVDEAGSQCDLGQAALSGSDAFVRISAAAGERWHFHLKPGADENVALYVITDSCDPRSCLDAVDVCGAGGSEHFTFIPERSGEYVVVADGLGAGGSVDSPPRLLTDHLVCGDGDKGHGEHCDDGNVRDGDGCDSLCRLELGGSETMEQEPNDDRYNANVLVPRNPMDPYTVFGLLGNGNCQADFYVYRVTQPGTLRVALRDHTSSDCADTPDPSLEVFEASTSDGTVIRSTLGRATVAGGNCPVVQREVQPGTYTIRVQQQAAGSLEYQLQLQLIPSATQ